MLPVRNHIWALETVAQITYTEKIRETKMSSSCISTALQIKEGEKQKTKEADRRKQKSK
jgi:hypothetical protein